MLTFTELHIPGTTSSPAETDISKNSIVSSASLSGLIDHIFQWRYIKAKNQDSLLLQPT